MPPIHADPAALDAAIAAAIADGSPNQVIEITGDFGGHTLTDKHAPGLTIRAVDPGVKNFGTLHMHRCSGFIVENVFIDYPAWDTMPLHIAMLYLVDCTNIVFEGCPVHGHDPGTGGRGYGLHTVRGSGVRFRNGELRDLARGANFGQTDDVEVSDSEIHNISVDGINVWVVRDCLIENNYIHDFFSQSGAHADMIQVHSGSAPYGSERVIIRGNRLDSGQGNETQSIFLGNGAVDGGQPISTHGYKDFIVEDNVIHNAHHHGISSSGCDGLIVRNNTIFHNQDTWNSGDISIPGINPGANDVNSTYEGNVGPKGAVQYQTVYGDPPATNSVESNYVNPLAGAAATMDDLQAKVGGHVHQNQLGSPLTLVGAVGNPPVANDVNFDVNQDVDLVVLTSDLTTNDTGDPPLTVISVENAVNGTVSLSGTTVTFTPDPGYFGPDARFGYTVSNAHGSDSAVAHVNVHEVVAPGEPPVVDGAAYTVVEDNRLSVLISDLIADACSHPQGDPINFVSVQGALNCTVSEDGTHVHVDPDTNFVGPAGYELTVESNGLQASGPIAVEVTEYSPQPQRTVVRVENLRHIGDAVYDTGDVEIGIPVT